MMFAKPTKHLGQKSGISGMIILKRETIFWAMFWTFETYQRYQKENCEFVHLTEIF